MDQLNDEQRAFLERQPEELGGLDAVLRNGGTLTFEQNRSITQAISTLSLEKDDQKLLQSLKLVPSTVFSGEIIRTLLIRAGTDCDKNDADPCGDGDQRMVKNESQAQILREMFASGGDLEHWIREYRFGTSKFSPFAWMCILGDVGGVEKTLKKTPLTERSELLEKRVTSMRFPLLILTIAVSKHVRLVNRYTSRPIDQMDHVGVVRVLLQYGASPNAREVTGKTACHYGAGSFATDDTMTMTDLALKATKTSSCVWKTVMLDGLSKHEYNGLEGILGGYVAETERRVFYPRDLNKKQLSVKPDNVFLLSKDDKRTCISDSILRPTNLAEVRDRTGAVSLHEVVLSERNDVAKFLLDRSPLRLLDIEDYTGTSARTVTFTPVIGSRVNDAVTRHIAKLVQRQHRKKGIRKEACEHCGVRAKDLGRELLQCTRCLSAYYCSKECLRDAWKKGNHKQECPEREKQGELVLANASDIPTDTGCVFVSTNYSTNAKQFMFRYGPPKGCKPNEKFWVKVQSEGIKYSLFIYDHSRHCCFYLAPGSASHKELVEKIEEEKAFEGRKSFFKAKFNDNGKCVVFLHTSTMQKW